MTMVPPKYAALRVRVTEADRQTLVARAQRDGVPVSVVMRRAFRAYLNQPIGLSPKPTPRYLAATDGRDGA